MPFWLFYEDQLENSNFFMDNIPVYLPGAVFPEPHKVLDCLTAGWPWMPRATMRE